jgi:class 3 adenylate cyclase/tetratricopeptide (TPR) repeat protein
MVDEIKQWLTDLDLAKYIDVFTANEIGFRDLQFITDADLRELGLPLGPRKRVLSAIEALDHESTGGLIDEQTNSDMDAERRQVTILFADVCGFTSLSERLGAEATHDLLSRFFDASDAAVLGLGGTIDKHIGDAVMAIFGAPIAHTDDPERAVRAACELHSVAQAMEPQLSIHIGIASGQVISSRMGGEGHKAYTVIGDSVNLSSRLTELAGPGETYSSSAIARGLGERIKSSLLGPLPIKGLPEAVEVWRIDGLSDESNHITTTAFVGRERERRAFAEAVKRCLVHGQGGTLLIRGEAGIGKTRLLQEFDDHAQDNGFDSHTGLILDFGAGKGRDAIGELVRGLLGLPSGSGKKVLASAVEQAVSAGLVAVEQRIHLYDLLDLPQPVELRALFQAMDSQTRELGRQEVLVELVVAQSAKRPILLRIEDLHWANESVLAQTIMVAQSISSCPVILVLTSRIAGDPFGEEWRERTNSAPVSIFDLVPLKATEAADLALAFADLDDGIIATCVARADGNPLFLEQLLRNVDELVAGNLPGTVQGIVQARMDAIPEIDRRALQAASVLGQRFSMSSMLAIAGLDDYQPGNLITLALIRRIENDYLFGHALICEGAYATLLTPRRRELHLKAAGWFADRDLFLHATHLDKADDKKAAEAYLSAGRTLADDFSYDDALAVAERGVEIAKKPKVRCELQQLRGDILRNTGQTDLSIEAFRLARSDAQDEGSLCRALIGIAAGLRILGQSEETLAAIDQAQPLAEAEGMTLELARIHHLRGNIGFLNGDAELCDREQQLALKYARAAGSVEIEAQAYSGIGDSHYMEGRMGSAYRNFQLVADIAETHNLIAVQAGGIPAVAHTLLFQSKFKDARQVISEGLELIQRVGHFRAEVIVRSLYGPLLCDLGDPQLGLEQAQIAGRVADRIGAKVWEPMVWSNMSLCQMNLSDSDAAIHSARTGAELALETSRALTGPWCLGILAFITDDEKERNAALDKGEALLSEHAVGHGHLYFYRYAIESSLNAREFDAADRYANLLEEFTRPEPLPWSNLVISRGRTLADAGRDPANKEVQVRLNALRTDVIRINMGTALTAIELALEA